MQTLSDVQVDPATTELLEKQKALAEQKRVRAERYQQLMNAMVAPLLALQSLTGWVARLEPHDIGVITVRRHLGPICRSTSHVSSPACTAYSRFARALCSRGLR